LLGVRRAAARWRQRTRRLGAQWKTLRGEWQAERDLERAIAGSGPIVVGPWRSEVGYEVLYWVPFVRWVMAAYRLAPERIVVMSRGGTESWYRGVGTRYVDIFDHVAPSELAARAMAGELKQREDSDFDRGIVERGCRALGIAGAQVLHPSLMFRWFAPFWSGHETLSFAERHTRYARVTPPDVPLPWALPDEYVAVKFYAARSLPDEPLVRAQLRSLMAALSERYPIVQLDTGLGLDDHADYDMKDGGRVLSVKGQLDPRTNLAVQTRLIAGARLFVGTCGSLAWLAPLLGVPTLALFTDASFLHAHLHVARRVYGRAGAARFSPMDMSGLEAAGLAVGSDPSYISAAVRSGDPVR
jgi:hypothetical protein